MQTSLLRIAYFVKKDGSKYIKMNDTWVKEHLVEFNKVEGYKSVVSKAEKKTR